MEQRTANWTFQKRQIKKATDKSSECFTIWPSSCLFIVVCHVRVVLLNLWDTPFTPVLTNVINSDFTWLIFTLHILHVQETKLTWDHRNENYTSTILFKQTKKEIRPDTLRHQKFTNHTFWKCRSYDVELKQMTHFITSSSPGYCVVYRLRFREVHYSGLELARHLHMLISSDLQSTRKKIQLTIK